MTERIKQLTNLTLKGDMYVCPVKTEFDREDIFLSPLTMNAKRTKEYILAQNPIINDDTALTGYLRFEGEVMGDNFYRSGHKNYSQMNELFYNKPIKDLVVFEFQHSVADFEKVIKIGLKGFKAEIAASKAKHTDFDRIEFLDALNTTADAIIGWANKCADIAKEKSVTTNDADAKVQPKHGERQGSQTAIGEGVAGQMVNIERKQKRKRNPSGCSDNRSG